MSIFKGISEDGKLVVVKVGHGNKLYLNGRDLGVRVTAADNIVDDNGQIVQNNTDIEGYLRRRGIFR